MVNFGLNPASFIGIFLAIAGGILYFLSSSRTIHHRSYDIYLSATSILCGMILLFQGWRLDPILQLGFALLVTTTVSYTIEDIKLRK